MTAADITVNMNSKWYWSQLKINTILSFLRKANTISPGEGILSTVTFPYYAKLPGLFCCFQQLPVIIYLYFNNYSLYSSNITAVIDRDSQKLILCIINKKYFKESGEGTVI